MEYEPVGISVDYGNQTYGGRIQPAKIELSNNGFDIRIRIDGRGESFGANVDVFGGLLVLPCNLSREIGEQLIKLSEDHSGKWRKDYPEQADRQRQQLQKDREMILKSLLGNKSKLQ